MLDHRFSPNSFYRIVMSCKLELLLLLRGTVRAAPYHGANGSQGGELQALDSIGARALNDNNILEIEPEFIYIIYMLRECGRVP